MKKLLIGMFLPVLFFVACSSQQPSQDTIEPPDEMNTTPENVTAPAEFFLDSPKEGETVSSPLEISGRASGYWFFEASFPVSLTTLDGTEIVAGFVMASADWQTPELVPFEGALEFDTDAEEGYLVFMNDNPSGLPENQISRKVKVKFTEETREGAQMTDTEIEEKVKQYIVENISDLNPAEPVLGGSWYVLEIYFGEDNVVTVQSEDGHIQNTFTAKYQINENGTVLLTDIVELDD